MLRDPSMVPTYSLYGGGEDVADVVHLEPISARSVRHDWTIRPHRHARLHQFLLIESGGGTAQLGGAAAALRPGLVLSLPSGSVHGFAFTPGTAGWVLTAPAEVLGAGLAEGEGLAPVLARPFAAPSEPAIAACFAQVAGEYAGRSFGRAHRLRALLALLAGLVARAAAREGQAADPLLARFDALVERELRNHWRVEDYARALGVTPGHLSRVTRRALGQSVSGVLRDRLLREARRELAYTRRTVADIAYGLGFADPAYFTRVFTRATGQAPTAFRAALDR